MSSKNAVVEQFTTQAGSFARNAHANDPGSLGRLVTLANPESTHRVLDVGCGPGIVATLLARTAGEVVGVDLTPAMVEEARGRAKEQALTNVQFQVGDALELPFEDVSFDIVVSRFFLHQTERAVDAIREQARVLRPGGRIVTFDSLTSEDASEAAYHNEIARLRESAAGRVWSLGQLVGFYARAGLAIDRYEAVQFTIGADEWIDQASAPEEARARARAMIRAAVGNKKFGGRHVFVADGKVMCVANWGLLVGVKR